MEEAVSNGPLLGGFSDSTMVAPQQTLIIDNFDSYTFNIYQAVNQLNGQFPIVVQNNEFRSWADLAETYKPLEDFHHVIIGPGPGTPAKEEDVRLSKAVLLACKREQIPVLGVCLGHQLIAYMEGNTVGLSETPMHGRLSQVMHRGTEDTDHLFYKIPSPFKAVRYHSLLVKEASKQSSSPTISVEAHTETGEIMALKVSKLAVPIWGVQFHPESILAECGATIFENFIRLALKYHQKNAMFSKPFSPSACPRVHNTLPILSGSTQRAGQSLDDTCSVILVHEIDFSETNGLCSEELYISYTNSFQDLSDPTVMNFWLDSEAFGSQNDHSDSRFTYIGTGSGPHCRAFECLLRKDATGNDVSFVNLYEKDREKNRWCQTSQFDCDDFLSFLEVELEQSQSKCFVCDFPEAEVSREGFKKTLSSAVPLTEQKQIPGFVGGFLGFLGYRMREQCTIEKQTSARAGNSHSQYARTKKTQVNEEDAYVPDAFYMFCDRVVVIDHVTNRGYLYCFLPAVEENWSDAIDWVRATEQLMTCCAMERKQSHIPKPLNCGREEDFVSEVCDEDYLAAIEKCQDYIRIGESYEICLTKRKFAKIPFESHPLDLYLSLRRKNPAPFASFLLVNLTSAHKQHPIELQTNFEGSHFGFCSSSPERFLKYSNVCSASGSIVGRVESKPIKGTIRRSKSPAEDTLLKRKLRASEKDMSENLMVVDLVRNDFGTVCDEVKVENLFNIESFATVHQMVSTVIGYIYPDKSSIENREKAKPLKRTPLSSFETKAEHKRPENRKLDETEQGHSRSRRTALSVLKASFPGGSMTGAPKRRTMELIDELESSERGLYSGCFGYVSLCGSCDTSIVIRSFVTTPNGISVGTGGAIVYLSDPEEELAETVLKTKALFAALKD